MRVVDYRVLTADDAGELGCTVRLFIEEGWEPLGGVSTSVSKLQIAGNVRGLTYAQAVVRREQTEPRRPVPGLANK